MSTASEAAYEEIRRRILSGELEANTQLTERELADICGTSRTPIRDVLRRLEAEGLVRRTDTQRCFIPDWTTDKVEEIFTLRAMVESHAALRAATRITNEQIAELQRYNDEISQSLASDGTIDVERFQVANRGFHRIVLEAAHSERLLMMRNLLFEPTALPLTARRLDQTQLRRSHADHAELTLAFLKHDSDWAQTVMNAHIRHAYFMRLTGTTTK